MPAHVHDHLLAKMAGSSAFDHRELLVDIVCAVESLTRVYSAYVQSDEEAVPTRSMLSTSSANAEGQLSAE